MGDEILMKQIILIALLSFYLYANNNVDKRVKNMENMFSKIEKKRVGVALNKIESLQTPFIGITENSKKKEKHIDTSLNLQVIMDKRVKINNSWYKLYETIGDKKIIYIGSHYVWLKNGVKKVKLSIRKKNEKIKIN